MNRELSYRVISKNSNGIRVMSDHKRVAEFMLARCQMGRGLRHYIVIKSDKTGDRIVNFARADARIIAQTLETA